MTEKIIRPIELTDDELDMVTGGSYVTASMTIGEIVETDSRLMGMLADAGIPVVGNKVLMGQSLMEVASVKGIDAYALENRMNDYLSGK